MKDKILFLGDSHTIHCFADGTVDVFYVVDITLNKIRQSSSDLFVKYLGFFPSENIHKYEMIETGESLLNLINNSEYEYVLLSVGEIDIRSHTLKLMDDNIFDNTIDIFYSFLKKISKKVILMSVVPPALTGNDSDTGKLEKKVILTNKLNSSYLEFANNNNYIYFDIYTDFVKDGFLDPQKSDGSVHISKSFQNMILSKLKNKFL